MKSTLRAIFAGIFAAFVALFFAIILAEWAVGCGETFTDSRGIKHQNECLFVK